MLKGGKICTRRQEGIEDKTEIKDTKGREDTRRHEEIEDKTEIKELKGGKIQEDKKG